MSLYWAGMVLGPHPVGLSWIALGSNGDVIVSLKFSKFNHNRLGSFLFPEKLPLPQLLLATAEPCRAESAELPTETRG